MAGVSEARREWLQKLEQQAASWIPEDKIDEVGTTPTRFASEAGARVEWSQGAECVTNNAVLAVGR